MPKIAEIKQTIGRINTQLNDQITQVGPLSLSPPPTSLARVREGEQSVGKYGA